MTARPEDIYRGLPPNWYFDVDPYVDLDGLRAIADDVLAGIARSRWGIGQIGNGHTHDDAQDLFEVHRQAMARPETDPVRQTLAGLDYLEQRRFLALKTKCLTLGMSITVRTVPNFNVLDPSDPYNLQGAADTPNTRHFRSLLAWIQTLRVFEAVGRVNIFLTPPGSHGEIHRDYHRHHGGPPRLPHFVWLQLERDKPLFLFDPATNEKRYVTSRAVWFNSNQHHGTDPTPFWTWSLRIDGKFSQTLAEAIGPAATR